MTDHDIHPGDTIGDYTITDINQDHDSHNLLYLSFWQLALWDRNAVMNAKRCLWVGHGSMLAPVFTTDPGVPRRAQLTCDDCNGTGQEILKVPLHDGGHMIYELEDPAPCLACKGTGHV